MPWTMEELSVARALMVTWIRDFIEDDSGWHTLFNRGKARPGGSKHIPTGKDLGFIVLQAHRQEGSMFSMHVVFLSLISTRVHLG